MTLQLFNLPQTVQPADAFEHLLLFACWHLIKGLSEHVEDVSSSVQLGSNESALRGCLHSHILCLARLEVLEVLLVGLLDDIGGDT